MDEWSFALLSCKVFIRCYLAEATIYRKGDPSDFAYIMLCGSVKVSVVLFCVNSLFYIVLVLFRFIRYALCYSKEEDYYIVILAFLCVSLSVLYFIEMIIKYCVYLLYLGSNRFWLSEKRHTHGSSSIW